LKNENTEVFTSCFSREESARKFFFQKAQNFKLLFTGRGGQQNENTEVFTSCFSREEFYLGFAQVKGDN